MTWWGDIERHFDRREKPLNITPQQQSPPYALHFEREAEEKPLPLITIFNFYFIVLYLLF
jgi:hypothetical protein